MDQNHRALDFTVEEHTEVENNRNEIEILNNGLASIPIKVSLLKREIKHFNYRSSEANFIIDG
jgi:hypothetical protein